MNPADVVSINNSQPPDIRAWFMSTWNEIGAAIATCDMARWNAIMNEPRLLAFVDLGSGPDDEEYQLTRACVRAALSAVRARWPIIDELNPEGTSTETPYRC